jgi:chemotaxis protein CheZ
MTTSLSKEDAFSRLGTITREMHEAMAALGGSQIKAIVEETPDARDRLAYIGKMTEDAANKVLNLVDEAKPACDDLATRGHELAQSLAKMAKAPDLTLERARAMMLVCGKFADRSASFVQNQASALSDIMMAQDFQDLSGQVIKKVIDIITRTEVQLVHLLLESAPKDIAAAAAATVLGTTPDGAPLPQAANVDTHTLEGPQAADKAMKQDDVDDLLASLGF